MYPVFVLLHSVLGYNNGLGRTPNMGWNPWNSFGCRVSQAMIKQAAQTIIDTGLAAKGYTVINLDDCWQGSRIGGIIQPDSNNFPSGLKALGDWLHSKSLKFGIYSSSGTSTCAGRAGSLNFETQDAAKYAQWGVDFLKYDDCGGDGGYSYLDRYSRMSTALNKSGRPIFYSITSGRGNLVRLIGSNSVRKIANSFTNFQSGDFYDNWPSFIKHLDEQVGQHNLAAPYAWSNPDMLQVGNPGMNSIEHQSHFALWALLKAPLVIGCDIAKVNEATLKILGNEEVIAINQDPLGEPGFLARRVKNETHEFDVWAARLTNDDWAVALLNRLGTASMVEFYTKDIRIRDAQGTMRDLINKTDIGPTVRGNRPYIVELPSHGVHLIRITGVFGTPRAQGEQTQ